MTTRAHRPSAAAQKLVVWNAAVAMIGATESSSSPSPRRRKCSAFAPARLGAGSPPASWSPTALAGASASPKRICGLFWPFTAKADRAVLESIIVNNCQCVNIIRDYSISIHAHCIDLE